MRTKLVVLFMFFSLSFFTAFAIDIPDSVSFTATVDLTGTGVQTWEAELKNLDDNSVSTDPIGWDNVMAGTPGYKVANKYIEVSTLITNPIAWRMLIFTSNLGEQEGLVGANGPSLPLTWRVQEELSTPANPEFSLSRPDGTEGFTDFQWKFMLNNTESVISNWSRFDDTFVRVWDNDGFYWNEGVGEDLDPDPDVTSPSPAPSEDNIVYIYLGTNFANSLAQSYTTSITIEVIAL